MAVHTDPSLADARILPGLFFSGRKKMPGRAPRAEAPLETLHGYVGWGPGNSSTRPRSACGGCSRHAPEGFSRGDDFWQELYAQASRLQLQTLFHIRYIPADPTLN